MDQKQADYLLLVRYLQRAYRDARRNKAGTNNCIRFGMNREDEICDLAQSILEHRYVMRPSICFLVTDPVMREVIAADFRDRLVHHLIFNFLNPHLEKLLIYDCYSCRKGKGTGFGIDRLEHHIRSCSRNYTQPCYALQIDISSYFMSIDRWKLYGMVQELMVRIGAQRDRKGRFLRNLKIFGWVEYLVKMVVLYDPMVNCEYRDPLRLFLQLPPSKSLRNSPEGVGLPIGNLTSQLFSNLYLNGFDQYMKRRLKVRHYGRYVDNAFCIGNDPEWLLSIVPKADGYLREHLGLHLNLKKTKLTDVCYGVSFLGIHLKPYRRYVKTKTLKRMQTEVIRMNRTPEYKLRDHRVREELLSKANSLLGILNQTRSYRIKRLLFANSIMYKFAYGDKYMQKFVLYGENQKRDVPPVEAELPVDYPMVSVPQGLFSQTDDDIWMFRGFPFTRSTRSLRLPPRTSASARNSSNKFGSSLASRDL